MRLSLIDGSIRRALLILVFASVLPALGIILYSGVENRLQDLEGARVSALRLANSMADIQDRTTQNIRLLLSALSRAPQVKNPASREAAELLAGVRGADPVLSIFFLAGTDGRVLAASLPFEPATVQDRPYFKEAMETGRFTVGEYQIGRIVNVPVLPFAQPLEDASGRPLAVLGAAIALDAYGELFGKADLPKNSVITLADRNGVRICRFPLDPAARAGQPLPPELWETVSRAEKPGTTVQAGADGVRRIYGYTQLRLSPGELPYMHILVGIPEEESQAAANASLVRNLELLALATLLALAISWTLWRPVLGRRIERLVDVTGRLGAGQLSARLENPARRGDLGSLERSVNAMAEALAQADEKRGLYEKALKKAGEELELRVLARTAELRDANRRLKSEMFERGRAEEALRESERMYRSLYEQAAVGIFILDTQGSVVDANPAALSLLGYTQEELTGLPYASLIHPDNLAATPLKIEDAVSGETLMAERVFVAKTGEQIPADVVNRCINRNLLQVVFSDATQRKKLEQLREDVERITRHDLKTPLMGVVHMPNLMLRDENLTPRQREMLEMVRESGYRMLRTINMSLALYKMESGTYECDRAEFDLLALTRRAVDESGSLGGAVVRVLLDGAEPGPMDVFMVQGEEPLCLTMLENLLKNAVEASPEGREVLVLLDGRERTLTVRNMGEVPPGIRERFFEKYSTQGKKWGTGLGTYSARLIAATHGWSLSLDCSVPGQTSVTVHFKPQE